MPPRHFNVPSTYRRCLDFVFAYLDNFLVASTSETEHEEHLRTIFTQIYDYGLVINPNKCIFGMTTVEFLGHLVKTQGINPLDAKVAAIRDFTQPTSLKKLRDFLVFLNFHRRFLPSCAQLIKYLTDLLATKKEPSAPLEWNEDSASAFSSPKKTITDAAMLI